MAVQAQQYPCNVFPDFRMPTRVVADNGLFGLGAEEINIGSDLFRVVPGGGGGGAVLVGDPESELTCNAPGPLGSRMLKRSRDCYQFMSDEDLRLAGAYDSIPQEKMMMPMISTGLQLSSYHQSRLLASGGTSTSGRAVAAAASPLAQELASCFYRQSLEIDALVRLQSERMRSGIEEARRRQCRTLLGAMEEGMGRRLREKEAELENAGRRIAELEERVRQMAAESQVWLDVAQNNEAIAASLRAALEQALLLQDAGDGQQQGDCNEGAAAEDAASCCFEEVKVNEDLIGGCGSSPASDAERENRELRWRKACKVCGESDVSVLVLPCRHLCLCQDCEPSLDTCPICHAVKNGSLTVFMS